MKRRRSRLLALTLSVCLTVTALSPVSAGVVVEPETVEEVTEDITEETEDIGEEPENISLEDVEEETEPTPEDQIEVQVEEEEVQAPETVENPSEEEPQTPEMDEVEDENLLEDGVTADVTYDSTQVTWEQDPVSQNWKLKDNATNEYVTNAQGIIVKVNSGTSHAYYNFDSEGNMLTGIQTLNSQLYYFMTRDTAVLKDGVAEETAKTPENSDLGAMAIDKVVPYTGNTYMKAGSNGVLVPVTIGWVETDGSKYYMDPEGNMIKDDVYMIDGVYYAFDTDGKMVSNDTYTWKKSGRTYFFDEDGKKYEGVGWQKKNDNWYYFHETTNAIIIKSGMQKIEDTNGKTYTFYFDAKGNMAREEFVKLKNNKEWYYFNDKGRMVTGLERIKVSNNVLTYFFRTKKGAKGEPVGSAMIGWYKHSNGFWYYFHPTLKRANFAKDEKGMAKDGLVTIKDKTYFLFDTGRAFKGGFKDAEGKRYYFNPQGTDKKPYMIKKTWIVKKNKWYRPDAKTGALIKDGWVHVGKYWYFMEDYVLQKNREIVRESNGKKYKGYLDDNGRFTTNSWMKSNGNWKYLDPKHGYIKNGWLTINGYKYYFDKNGYLCQDLRKMKRFSNKGSSAFNLWVDRNNGVVTVMGKNPDTGKFNIPVVKFLCSVGQVGVGTTPTGTFQPRRGNRWQELMGPSWGQYGVNVYRGIYFHSIAGSANNNHYAISASDFNRLGTPASHGCIRLCVSDAKWIYENAYASTTRIYAGSNRPKETKFDRPTLPKIPSSQHHDPTDPAVPGSRPSPHINPYKG